MREVISLNGMSRPLFTSRHVPHALDRRSWKHLPTERMLTFHVFSRPGWLSDRQQLLGGQYTP